MPIRDEYPMLLRTLPSILALNPDELLIGLDRNGDAGHDLIWDYLKTHRPPTLRRLYIKNYTEEDGRGWAFRGAYLRRDLYSAAENDTIVNTSGDLCLDPRIAEYAQLVPKCGLVSFGYWDYPWTYQCFMRRIISDYSPVHGFAGLLAFSKRAWLEAEDLENLKRAARAEDTHLQMAIKLIKPTRHVNTETLHLRPREDRRSHYNRGVAQWEMLHNPAYKSFLHSLVMLRPAVFAGYMHARGAFR
jgi:hypothetical protein